MVYVNECCPRSVFANHILRNPHELRQSTCGDLVGAEGSRADLEPVNYPRSVEAKVKQPLRLSARRYQEQVNRIQGCESSRCLHEMENHVFLSSAVIRLMIGQMQGWPR
jgi:hypothetical protein